MNNSTIYLIKATIFYLAVFPFILELFAFICILRFRKFATNINKTTNDFFRSIKLRYTNSAKLDITIRSTRTFVDRSLLGKGGAINYIYILDRITLFFVSINLTSGVIFLIAGHTYFSYIIAIMSFCFYIFRQGCSIDTHIQFISSMIVEHLENTLYHKTKPQKERASFNIMPISNKATEPSDINNKLQSNNPSGSKQDTTSSVNSDATPAATNHIIESILHEFLS